MRRVWQEETPISCCCLKAQGERMRNRGGHCYRWLCLIQCASDQWGAHWRQWHNLNSRRLPWVRGVGGVGGVWRRRAKRKRRACSTCSRGEKAETRCILLWISRLTCAPSPPVSNWSRQWRVRHASATAIGRLMRWHQAREWLIGLMRITVSKCFFIPLWLAMQQICYLYSRLWWITETHSLRLHRVQSWLPGRHSAQLFAIADLLV